MPDIILDPDPQSTYEASEEYIAAWQALYGSQSPQETTFGRYLFVDSNGELRVDYDTTLAEALNLQFLRDSAVSEIEGRRGAADGYAPLDSAGVIPSAQLPSVSFIDTYPVANEAAMLALDAQRGDVAIRADESRTYMLRGDDPTNLADWIALATPTDVVLSVDGRVGVIDLSDRYEPLGAVEASRVSAAAVNEVGRLILTMSSGTTYDAGYVVGPKGDKGDQGIQGIPGIQGVKGDKGDPGDLSSADAAVTFGGNVDLSVWSPPVTKHRTMISNATITALPSNPGSTRSGTVTLVLKQAPSGQGPFTVTWPATLEWANDALAPAMPTAANAEMIVHLFWTGQAWRAMFGGVFYP